MVGYLEGFCGKVTTGSPAGPRMKPSTDRELTHSRTKRGQFREENWRLESTTVTSGRVFLSVEIIMYEEDYVFVFFMQPYYLGSYFPHHNSRHELVP